MKFNKGKCRVLHLVRNNPKYQHRLEADLFQSRSVNKQLGVVVNDHKTAAPLQPGVPMVSWHASGRVGSREVILPLYWALERSIVFDSGLHNSRKTPIISAFSLSLSLTGGGGKGEELWGV